MQYFGSLEAAEKHIPANIFKENLQTSVKILQICMVVQDSVQRPSLNPAEKSPAELHRFAKVENPKVLQKCYKNPEKPFRY